MRREPVSTDTIWLRARYSGRATVPSSDKLDRKPFPKNLPADSRPMIIDSQTRARPVGIEHVIEERWIEDQQQRQPGHHQSVFRQGQPPEHQQAQRCKQYHVSEKDPV